jgi:GNAT superfamily N-acetyltransferase
MLGRGSAIPIGVWALRAEGKAAEIKIMDESNRKPNVRVALPADAEVIAAMAAELAAAVKDPRPDFDAARFIRDGFGPDRWFECLIAEIEGQPVGYALMCRGFEAHTGKRRLWLGDLYVRAAARRGGAGRSLMAAVASRALELDCEAVYWELWRPNALGKAFYERLAAEEAADLAVMRLGGERLSAAAQPPGAGDRRR